MAGDLSRVQCRGTTDEGICDTLGCKERVDDDEQGASRERDRSRRPPMKVLRMLGFAVLGALLSAAGTAWSQAGRQPVDWAGVSLESIGGGPLPTADYAGKVVLLVNTASLCGFTGQYKGLEELWRRYKDKGLVVLGVPSNDFGAQEPRSEGEIAKFCESMYSVTFPLTAKQKVIGAEAHPLYQWIAKEAGEGAVPKWNFHKYLIGKDGSLLGAWPSRVRPSSTEITSAIEAAL